jgi:chromosomal replication initiator protein
VLRTSNVEIEHERAVIIARLNRPRDSRSMPAAGGGTTRLAAQQDLDRAWVDIQSNLESSLPETTFRIWLARLRPVAVKDTTLYVDTPEEIRTWVRRRFGPALNDAACRTESGIKRVELSPPDSRTSAPQPGTQLERRDVPGRLKHGFTFDRFVIGHTNRFAHAAALAAAELPGHAYNPLTIYGAPGTGKTHLLHAIGNYITTHDTSLSLYYTTIEAFTGEFTAALKQGDIDAFKKKHRGHDVLLLDDLQSLQGKQKTAEELFHTFDHLTSTGAQVVITCDRHPANADYLDPRFKERLEAGLAIDLEPPDRETRLAILHKLASRDRMSIQASVLEHIADRVPFNVRALEGALIRIVAFASLNESPIDIELAERVLTTLYPNHSQALKTRPKRPNSAQIQHETAAALDLESADLSSTKRSRPVVYARHVAMYLCRELAGLSFPEIARLFHRQDHTSALHAHRKIKAQILSDHETRTLVAAITESLHTEATSRSQREGY